MYIAVSCIVCIRHVFDFKFIVAGKSSSRANSEFGDDHASSTVSLCGRSSATDDLDAYSDQEEDEFAIAIENLYEKRSATREAALQKLVSLLMSQWQLDECTFKLDTLSRLFLTSFKKGGADESILAARAVALHVITLGASDEAEGVFRDALPAFVKIIETGRIAVLRAAAIESLSILCFVAAEGPEETMEIMSLLSKAYTRQSSTEVQSEALRGWSLLFTTLPASKFGSSFVEEHLKILSVLLHSKDVDVRSAAGEAVTLLYHTCDLSMLPETLSRSQSHYGSNDQDDTNDFHKDDSQNGHDAPGAAESLQAERLEDIVKRMQDLAKNRGDETRRSKKDRASLRSTFRELSSIIDGGDIPQQKVTMPLGDTLVVDTLSGNIQLNAVRSFLGEGFQVHMLNNPLLHQVFNFRPRNEPSTKYSGTEKRQYRSPASGQSKERSKMRQADRRAAHKDRMWD